MTIGAYPIGSFSIAWQIVPGPSTVVFGGATTEYRDEYPPEGYRRVLDTSGIDLVTRQEALLRDARREIGLLPDEPIPALPEPIKTVPIEARIQIPEPPVIDLAAIEAAAELRAQEAEAARRARRAWLARDQEDMLILLAAAL